MAYATREELAQALGNIPITPLNTEALDACLAAAAAEIDHTLDRVDPLPDPAPELVVRTNVNRAVEWFKAPDAYNGGVGFADVGALTSPASGFERHAAVLIPFKQQWGIG